MPNRPTVLPLALASDVVDDAQILADRPARLATAATELGHRCGYPAQRCFDSAGLMVVATPQDSDRHAATVVPRPASRAEEKKSPAWLVRLTKRGRGLYHAQTIVAAVRGRVQYGWGRIRHTDEPARALTPDCCISGTHIFTSWGFNEGTP